VKDILVTGAGGQLGAALARQISNHPRIRLHLFSRSKLDIANAAAVSQHFSDHQYYGVINCAAYTAVDLAESNREEAFKINAQGAANVARACLDSASKLFHISTDYVFNGESNTPYLETDELNPINVYGESKAEGERLIQELNAYASIIRTSWLVDPEGRNFVNTMKRLGIERDSIQVVEDQISSPTWAPLLADGLLCAIDEEQDLSGLYHYAHDNECSWKNFTELIFDILDIECKVYAVKTKDFGASARRPKYSKLDTTKLKGIGSFQFPKWDEATRQFLQLSE
jgi:dTDP-4-dehydrorhamnose reductase